MTNMARFDVTWTGGSVVGPGLSTFWLDPSTLGVGADIRDFFVSCAPYIATGVSWSFPSSGDLVDDGTGDITGTWTSSALAPVNAAGAAPVMGVGARVEWLTGAVYNGRRRRGRTFLVPASSAEIVGQGMLSDNFVNNVGAAASTLVTAAAGSLMIWTRPTTAHPVGAAHAVTSGYVPDQVSWLRSRRT